MKTGKVDYIIEDVDREGLGCEIRVPGFEIISIIWRNKHTEEEMFEVAKKAFNECDVYDRYNEQIFIKTFLEKLGE